jgi:hypothetical protein
MQQASRLIVAMADQCRRMIQPAQPADAELPTGLQPRHLLWMCDTIVEHAEDWPATKLHRWIGFVQGAMLANRVLDLEAARAMFEKTKAEHGEIPDDKDLIDHLDTSNSFRMELGGQG